MNEALIFFIITLALFVAGMYFASPLIGLNTNGYSTSRNTNNITVTTITRNGETYTVTLPKNTGSSRGKEIEIELLEIIYAYAEKSDSKFILYIEMKNTGTEPVTIDNIFINNKPCSSYNNVRILTPEVIGEPIQEGETITIKIELHHPPFTSGQIINIVIQTTSGIQYPATVTLP